MIYSFRSLTDCAMNSVVYLDGNEHDAYQITGLFGADVEVTNLTTGSKLKLPGDAYCERPTTSFTVASNEATKQEVFDAATALAPIRSTDLQKQEKILSEEVQFHRTRAIASRQLGNHHVEEHEVTASGALHEWLAGQGYDFSGLDCTEVVLSGVPRAATE